MKISTANTLLGKLCDITRINQKFHQYQPVIIESRDNQIVSPVEATVNHIGDISEEGVLLTKRNKIVKLYDLIGQYAKNFYGCKYLNLYLSPLNLHFWVTPTEGKFIHIVKNEGKSKWPVFIGLEDLIGIEMFSKAVIQNSSIGMIYQTGEYDIAMVAVGSLNVNRIHVDCEIGKQYERGVPCGYFSLGSSMLLCFPRDLKPMVHEGKKVRIGQAILS
ncbi:phosphatidylserine decarboxylase [archaeon]|jgi:phosphatidylserine decarboxylase|nr:phosphatidylserine decarboxylase [archaeon]MBT3450809.1 phosphatidylserine decarboxylase [archaeon]MBT6868482.1 phosphatidylserine decarboxylase [archaeon]MBT7193581.1 phosphatidylserine decarboxylase [archaeon]MBT7380282.1 phosphatidylserine decarboxylase [archaeon]